MRQIDLLEYRLPLRQRMYTSKGEQQSNQTRLEQWTSQKMSLPFQCLFDDVVDLYPLIITGTTICDACPRR